METKGRLFLNPPKRPLDGVPEGSLLEVVKSVYGLPDAPRAWWEEVTKFLRSLGFQHSRMDVAFLVRYGDEGSLSAMIVLHVDDMMIAHDGSTTCKHMLEKIRNTYPMGEWTDVASQEAGVQYTGRTVRLDGS